MKVKVDKEKCIGCGACVALCGEVFELKDGKSHVKENCKCEDCDCCKQAAEQCPVDAITVE